MTGVNSYGMIGSYDMTMTSWGGNYSGSGTGNQYIAPHMYDGIGLGGFFEPGSFTFGNVPAAKSLSRYDPTYGTDFYPGAGAIHDESLDLSSVVSLGQGAVALLEAGGSKLFAAGMAAFAKRGAAEAAPGVPAAGEDLFVGLYGKSRSANKQSGLDATHTPHHVVQDAVSGTSRYSGVTINLNKDLHALTRTLGRNADLGSNVRNLAADVRDLRNILRGAGYDRSLVNQQMQRLIDLNRQVGNVPP